MKPFNQFWCQSQCINANTLSAFLYKLKDVLHRIPNVQKPSVPCFNIQIDFFFSVEITASGFPCPLSAFPVSCCGFCLFCFVFRDTLMPSQRLLLPLSWITSDDEFSLNYYPGDRELLCSATTIFYLVMGTLLPGADLQYTSPLISASVLYVACAQCAFPNFAAGVGRASLGLWQVMPCYVIVMIPEFYSSI